MDSDEEPMEEPPTDYFKTRRRSNTLPSDILRHMRDKQSLKKDKPQEDNSDDEADGEGGSSSERPQLSDQFKKLHVSDSSSNGSIKVGTKYQKGKQKDSVSLSLTHRIPVTSYDDAPLSLKNSKPAVNHRLDGVRNNLIRAVSDETLLVKKRRKPLPRGSNVYEKALEDFGHDEEDRDQVSPLSSPQIRRHGRHNAKHTSNVSGAHSGSPPRHVHWAAQDTRNNKVKR